MSAGVISDGGNGGMRPFEEALLPVGMKPMYPEHTGSFLPFPRTVVTRSSGIGGCCEFGDLHRSPQCTRPRDGNRTSVLLPVYCGSLGEHCQSRSGANTSLVS